jgi:hypothetical protein
MDHAIYQRYDVGKGPPTPSDKRLPDLNHCRYFWVCGEMDKSGVMIGRETRHHDRGWRNRTRQLTIAPQERTISSGDSLIRARLSEHFESRTYERRPK